MRRRRNSGVIFTGCVGSKYVPRVPRPSRLVMKHLVPCVDGPLKDFQLCLVTYGDLTTLPFTLRGQTGRYAAGKWEGA